MYMTDSIFLREHYPLQQGLRLTDVSICSVIASALREHYPLQQGLRRTACDVTISGYFTQRALSITTRIKTANAMTCSRFLFTQRALSITTRIKTFFRNRRRRFWNPQRALSITTRIKTGHLLFLFQHHLITQRALSITTRIKTAVGAAETGLTSLREHCPLQQGLRLYAKILSRFLICLREHCPLQQGLRLSPWGFLTSLSLREHHPL